MKTLLIRQALQELMRWRWYYVLTVPERLRLVHKIIFDGRI